MQKFYTITIISLLMLFVSVRNFAAYYHVHSVLDISKHIAHVYADGDGGDGGGDGGDGGGEGDGGGDGGDGGDGGGDGDDGGGDGDDDNGGDGPTCPIAPQDGRILVDLGTGVIVSSGVESSAIKGPISVSIPAGDYKVTLVSYDQHSIKPDQVQPNESWYLVIKNSSGGLIINTNAIGDLPQDEEYKVEEVNTNLALAQNAASVTAFHAAYPNPNANSITPLCASFDKVMSSPATSTLNVNSSGVSNVSITRVSGPSDIGGITNYTRIKTESFSAVLQAPAIASSTNFSSWTGCDSVGGSGNRDCTISVNTGQEKTITANYVTPPPSSCPLPTINSSLSANATVNQAFSYTLTATTTGVTSTTTIFAVATSSLPSGLSYATSTMSISGIPTQTGTFNIAVSAKNDCGIDSKTLVIIVNTGGGGGSSGVNLTVTKITDKSTAKVGDTLTYTINLINNGPNDAVGVVVTDTLPGELDFVSATSTSGTYATSTGLWTVGDLLNGSSTTLTLIGTIKSGNEGKTIINTAVASSTQTDPHPDDNTSSVSVAVDNVPACTENCGGGGGGGGGGSGSGGGSSGSGGSSVPSVVINEATCFYLRDYMRRDFNNDPIEVLKLQAFLRNFEGHSEVSLTGVFDQATFDAVSAFQMKYFSDILEPWGHTGPTGYVYILTLKKINEIYCQRIYPLNQAQINEIAAFRALLESLRAQGLDTNLPSSPESGSVEEVDTSTTTIPVLPVVGEAGPPKGQNLAGLAAAIFALPNSLLDALKCSYEFLLILIVLYILGNVLKDVLYKDAPENTKKRFFVKWLTIDIGIAIMIVIAYIMEWWCLILPLILALIISVIWTLTYSRHNSARASVKSWYLVGSMRIKSLWKNARTIEKKEKEPVIILPPLISKRDK